MLPNYNFLFAVVLLGICPSLKSDDQPGFLVTILLVEFDVPDNKLLNGIPCDEFDFLGSHCDVNLRLCVEDLKISVPTLETCVGKGGDYLDTNVVTPDSDIVFYYPNNYYGDWPNPYRFVGVGEYKGIRLKVIVEDSCFENCSPVPLIDQFQQDITLPPGVTNSIMTIRHMRGSNISPTTLKIKVSVACLNENGGKFNANNCLPIQPSTVSPPSTLSTVQPTTTELLCKNGGTPNNFNHRCICPPLFNGKYCEYGPTRNCYDLYKYYDITGEGLHSIIINGNYVQVYCQQGWTLLQRRIDDGESFNRTWAEYRRGFGNIKDGSFWLGNDNIYYLTNDNTVGTMSLRVDLWDCIRPSPNAAFEIYPTFKIDSSATNFTLHVSQSGNHGTAGDALNQKTTFGKPENGQMFIVPHHDNQPYTFTQSDCANIFHSGWWYGDCGFASLNGLYHSGCNYDPPSGYETYFGNGILWQTWYERVTYSLARSEMKMRPADVQNTD